MFKVTMSNDVMGATVMANDLPAVWQTIAPAIALGGAINLHVEDEATGEVVLLFQDGEIKHMGASAVIGFLDMVYAVDPKRALAMAFDLLAGLESIGLGE
jgi:hypothetical protein